MTTSNEIKRPRIYPSVIFALIFIFNPNISIIDPLPDFVAYFVLARAFLYASDCAPHFEGARLTFRKLGWLNFAKFFGLAAILLVRGQNSSDSDIIPLVTFAFAICEALLSVVAIRHIFNALFYLGNRSNALATIRPFKAMGTTVRPETVRNLSYFFVIIKCVSYFAPTPMLLTRDYFTSFIGNAPTKWFIGILLGSAFLTLIVGIVWLIFTIRYAKEIRNEGMFIPSLNALLKNNVDFSIERKLKLRYLMSSLTFFTVASFFTLELSLVENYDVNLIPHFIYATIMFIGALKISRASKKSIPLIVSGAVYIITSFIAYVIQTSFLTKYGYAMLIIVKSEARSHYPAVIFSSVVEFISLFVFLVFLFKVMRVFILENTGINSFSRDIEGNDVYFGSLLKKNLYYFIAALTAALIKLISVILHGSVKLVYSDNGNELKAAIVSPAIEWIGLAVAIAAFVYIGVTFYFISTLKDEVKMRYEDANTNLN
ncbi:MAG: hypothetical protein IKV16_06835 [Clostridia bacterium]|nr:hypothetical protein [Clostridia bacterium]